VRGWRGRLGAGAALALLAGAIWTLAFDGYTTRLLRNPTDARLQAMFDAHRAEFEELAHLAVPRSDRRWRALVRRLRLDGDHPRSSDSLMYFAASGWFARTRLDDVKGYAYSSAPVANLVPDLDRVAVEPRGHGDPQTWHRALEGPWYLYRERGSGRYR